MERNESFNALTTPPAIGGTMTSHQLQAELLRCEYCEEKPCQAACPANCSPFDFIMAARVGNPSDIKRAAGEIMRNNPLGGVCGMVCPDTLCMAACIHKKFDGAINIPQVQATVVAMAKQLGGIPEFSTPTPNGKKIAVVGGGPAGLGAAAALAQMGYAVDIFEAGEKLGGALNLIPESPGQERGRDRYRIPALARPDHSQDQDKDR